MADDDQSIERVTVIRCNHGNFHLHLGKHTLHLTPRELTMLARAIRPYLESPPNNPDPTRTNWN